MIIVTGGAGFIGSRLIKQLNERGETDILVVDHQPADVAQNLSDCTYNGWLAPEPFRQKLTETGDPFGARAILHQGACTDTLSCDRDHLFRENFEFSVELLRFAAHLKVPMIYASSAAVYGASTRFDESPANESPLNLYAETKLTFDNHVREHRSQITSPVVGLRYFNVYGAHEAAKGRMASMIFQMWQQLQTNGRIRLFGASHGCNAGEQSRDFIFVDDVVDAILFFLDRHAGAGIYNVGTGRARTFNQAAHLWIRQLGFGEIEYTQMPDSLVTRYQSRTCAHLGQLRAAGYDRDFTALEDGIKQCFNALTPKVDQTQTTAVSA